MTIKQGWSNLSCIRKIILNAKKELIISSPYIKLSKKMIEEFSKIVSLNIEIDIITLKQNVNIFKNFKGLNVYSLEDLHAKYYMNENEILITSQNYYKKNDSNRVFELGIYYQKGDTDFIEIQKRLLSSHKSHVFNSELQIPVKFNKC